MSALTEPEALYAAQEMLANRARTPPAEAYQLARELRSFGTPETAKLAVKLARAFCVVPGKKK